MMDIVNPFEEDSFLSMLAENENIPQINDHCNNISSSPNSSSGSNTASTVLNSDDEDISNSLFDDKDDLFLDSFVDANFDKAFNSNENLKQTNQQQQYSPVESASLIRKNSFDSLSKLSAVSLSTYSSSTVSTSKRLTATTTKVNNRPSSAKVEKFSDDDENDDMKKQTRKEKNRQSAADSRMRRKILMDNLMAENSILLAKLARYEALYGPLPDNLEPVPEYVMESVDDSLVIPTLNKNDDGLRRVTRKHKLENEQKETLEQKEEKIIKQIKSTLPLSQPIQPPLKKRGRTPMALTPLKATSVATIGLSAIMVADSMNENGNSAFSPTGQLSFFSQMLPELRAADILNWFLICIAIAQFLFIYSKLYASSSSSLLSTRKRSVVDYPIKRSSSSEGLSKGYLSASTCSTTL